VDFREATERAQQALQQGRIRTAKLLFQRILPIYPQHGVFLHYNLGCVYRSCIGNGTKARQHFQQALEAPAPPDVLPGSPIINTIRANAIENLMLLSLSFDEFFTWVERLARLQPENPILTKHRADIEARHQQGVSWIEMMKQQAYSYFSADPSQDAGLYAEAAATLELLLTNRDSLRVPRTEQRFAVISYAGLIMKTCVKHGMTAERTLGGVSDPEELRFIAEEALPLIRQYTESNTGDEKARECVEAIDHFLASHDSRLPTGGPAVVRVGKLRAQQVAGVSVASSAGGGPSTLQRFWIRAQWLLIAALFATILIFGLVKAYRP